MVHQIHLLVHITWNNAYHNVVFFIYSIGEEDQRQCVRELTDLGYGLRGRPLWLRVEDEQGWWKKMMPQPLDIM